MARLVLQVQEPTIELKVTPKSSSPKKQTVLIGFKRYEADEGKAMLERFQEISSKDDFEFLTDNDLTNFIKESIVYIKNVSFEAIGEDGKSKSISISDTRIAKPVETLWDTPEECLSALVDAFLKWASWRVSLISAVQTAMLDLDMSDDAVKN